MFRTEAGLRRVRGARRLPERGPGRVMSVAAGIRKAALDLGFTQVGFAPAERPVHADVYLRWVADGWQGDMAWMAREDSVRRRLSPAEALPGCRSIVVVSLQYGPIEGFEPGPDPLTPIVATYAEGRDYHAIFEERLDRLADVIREHAAHSAHATDLEGEPGIRKYVDYGPVLERDHAQRAGLGWIGRNSCLIHPRLGSYLFLGELLTTLPIPPDPPFVPDRCGTCTRCIDACPTGAIKDGRLVDARSCISYLTIELRGSIPIELRPAIGNRVFGCDICQEVCPWNDGLDPADRELFIDPGAPPDRGTMLEWAGELLELTDAAFRDRYRESPLSRPGRDGLLRNLCVGLGNSGSEEVIPVLRRALSDESELVREHAAWGLLNLEAPSPAD